MADWAKVHTDILGDRKLMRAAREGAKRLDLLPWLLAFARQAKDGGRLTVGGKAAESADIAPLIPCISEQDVTDCLTSLTEIGVLAADPDGVLRFVKWEERQAKPSDSKEAILERVRKHRRRKKKDVTPVTPHVKRVTGVTGVTPSNALHVTPRNATDKKYPTGTSSKPERSLGASALADAARSLDAEQLVEPTREEQERARMLAEKFRAVESA